MHRRAVKLGLKSPHLAKRESLSYNARSNLEGLLLKPGLTNWAAQWRYWETAEESEVDTTVEANFEIAVSNSTAYHFNETLPRRLE